MAKKTKAIYAPGELSKVRGKLGNLNDSEAKRMARILGGEVGYERSEVQEDARHRKQVRHETVEVAVGDRKPFRRVETAGADSAAPGSAQRKIARRRDNDPVDDPSVPVKASYWERVRMDKYMGQPEFEIKSSGQVLFSMLSILNDPPDMVSPVFVNRRMNNYYKRIELLVTSMRSLLPRNNLKRNEKLKKASPFAFAVLDTIRYWNIDQISSSLSKIQAHPRNAKVQDFQDILRDIYRPLFILEKLDVETHIKGSFKLLYKILYLENPGEAKTKYQELIRNALVSYGLIHRDIRFQLYPMLLKLLSNCWIPYESFFVERKNRIRALLQVTEKNRISPNMGNAAEAEEAAQEAEENGESGEQGESGEPGEPGKNEDGVETVEVFDESDMDEPLTEEERIKRQYGETEKKAVDRGLSTLEALFPKAGWERIRVYPDFYPYFSDVFHFKKGFELVAPTDPLQQIVILMRILEELFFGLRYVIFGVIMGPDGSPERIDDSIGRIINEWQKNTETSLDKEYLPRLDEYCRLLENTAESRTSNYAKRLLNELHWIKRLYFLPYYKFESIMPPPFQKNAITAVYPEIRLLRKYLTAVATGIDQGIKRGGMEKHAPCDGIDNPWDSYIFQVPNPLSIRLDALLSPKRRNNASLIFFTLAVTVLLDHLVNNEDSWAYSHKAEFLFRSENGEGVRPLFGVETKIDTEAIFRQVLKKRTAAAALAAAEAKASEINV
ncbi:MAG: hypothetical protein LBI67_03670 [Treponema sp.]|jgi:hypothetical protein|nr:hypothetical protein [Treponema sp.]